jgi:hypothetical protein
MTTTHVTFAPTALSGGVSADTAPTDIYIATTGDDSTGAGTSGSPWKTLAKALAALPSNLGQPHTIHVADGTYAEAVSLVRFWGSRENLLTIVGNTTTPANVKFTGTVVATRVAESGTYVTTGWVANPCFVKLSGITLQGDGTAVVGLFITSGAYVIFDRCKVQTSSGNYQLGVYAHSEATIDFYGNCAVINCSAACIEMVYGCKMYYNSAGTLTLTGTGFGAGGYGIQAAYQNRIIPLAASAIVITACSYGIALSHHTHFSSFNTTVSITNTSNGSSAIRCTDMADFAIVPSLTLDHFAIGIELNSISYCETHSRTYTNLTATSSVGTGSIYNPV